MKFTLDIGKKGLRVRREILDASGFQKEKALDVHGLDHAVVILEEKMTAEEMVRAIHSLKDLASDLLVHLAKVCGPCEHCESPCPCTQEEEPLQVPEELLKQAGIPKDANSPTGICGDWKPAPGPSPLPNKNEKEHRLCPRKPNPNPPPSLSGSPFPWRWM